MTTSDSKLLLITGATGKVGRAVVTRLLAEPAFAHWRVRALCHQRVLPRYMLRSP